MVLALIALVTMVIGKILKLVRKNKFSKDGIK